MVPIPGFFQAAYSGVFYGDARFDGAVNAEIEAAYAEPLAACK